MRTHTERVDPFLHFGCDVCILQYTFCADTSSGRIGLLSPVHANGLPTAGYLARRIERRDRGLTRIQNCLLGLLSCLNLGTTLLSRLGPSLDGSPVDEASASKCASFSRSPWTPVSAPIHDLDRTQVYGSCQSFWSDCTKGRGHTCMISTILVRRINARVQIDKEVHKEQILPCLSANHFESYLRRLLGIISGFLGLSPELRMGVLEIQVISHAAAGLAEQSLNGTPYARPNEDNRFTFTVVRNMRGTK